MDYSIQDKPQPQGAGDSLLFHASQEHQCKNTSLDPKVREALSAAGISMFWCNAGVSTREVVSRCNKCEIQEAIDPERSDGR